ncbi:hypothetical protein CEF12_09295 [Enterococcus faecalis]|uniref:Uncharacterized protein n=5 Tax=Enterococcus faecalis TaxID=1351 RepID=Q831V8_ENTFA|nr:MULTISPECIES: hypothetical protein [Enterococcus]AAO82110.1 hypothetical protein EF_2389 [Enterococcus faecalis V583]EET98701.1 predicted protein [Enterococcus faecalis T2]EEU85883.1 predicted protein [Enterococcus faecalis CH188]EFQ16169.1 hypothetical protein HMPREF9512_01451 [Enterococcus faecalis EnGen0311]EFU90893.1 hypothetical protein HMPREF9511_01124 [Enterococcus faecalis TX0630]
MIVEMTSFLLMSHHISKLLTSFLRGAVCNIRIDRLRYFSIYVDESIPNDKQAISEAIERLKELIYLFRRRWEKGLQQA